MFPYCTSTNWFWWPVGWLIFLLLISLVFGRFRRWGGRHNYYESRGGHRAEDPMRILQLRYAKGEITQEQFDEMQKHLGVHHE